MKTKYTLKLLAALLLLSILNRQLSTAATLGPAFTYQGRLTDGGLPATNIYDLSIILCSTATGPGGQVVGSTAVISQDVPVTNGLFTVTLNNASEFGANAFDGSARWLEISVRPGLSTGAYTTVLPRQPLLPTPYATYSGNAAQLGGQASTAYVAKAGDTMTGTLNVIGGNIGVGTTTPAALLDLLQPSASTAFQGFHLARSGKSSQVYLGVADSDYGYFDLGGGTTIRGAAGGGLGSTFGGNVGIGTTSPAATLDVQGTLGLFGTGLNGSALQRFQLYADTGNGFLFEAPQDSVGNKLSYHFNWRGGGPDAMTISSSGGVGIGTTTPGNPLTVQGNGVDQVSWRNSSFELGRLGYSGANAGWLGLYNSGTPNVYIRANGTTFFNGGNVGIGTTSPAFILDVAGRMQIRDGAGTAGIWLNTAHSSGTGGVADIGFVGVMDSTRIGFYGNDPRGTPLGWGMTFDTVTGNVGIGTGATYPTSKLRVNGDASVCTLTITGGCDLSEPFQVSSAEAPKGTVMIIDPLKPGQLKISENAYDNRVAGIISGANGINPAISMQQDGLVNGGQNVALSGRVYAMADASRGAIHPGDLLTTSSTPGHCMRVADHARAQGAIIGKAMSSLENGKGMVLVLVSLQ